MFIVTTRHARRFGPPFAHSSTKWLVAGAITGNRPQLTHGS